MRKYINNYVKISKSLQNKKTLLFKKIVGDKIRSTFFFVQNLDARFNHDQTLFFQIFQKILFVLRYLVHCNFIRQFFINVDASKKIEIDAMIYHSKKSINGYSSRFMIELIMFLNRKIISIEFKY